MKSLLSVTSRFALILSACFSLEVLGAADERQGVDSANVPRYLEVTPNLGTGGQPSEEGLRALAKNGYKAVINLRTSQEGVDLAAEEKLVRELGLKYFNIPFVASDPKEEQAVEFLDFIEKLKDQKVFIHCASANRVGCFVMIQRVLKDGVSPGMAEEEANRIGLRSEVLRQFAKDFLEQHKK
jgi:protein tyrosine phosphatase (PTP) superfamily phosphohydrolase (DUF442 family)